jgi:hypothetical protein
VKLFGQSVGLFCLCVASLLGPSLAWAEPVQQAVIVYLKLSDGGFGAEGEPATLFAVEDAVAAALPDGAEDGNEIGGGYFAIYAYGPDAEAMLKAIAPVLTGPLIKPGSYAVVRFGPPGAKERRMALPISPTGVDHHEPR